VPFIRLQEGESGVLNLTTMLPNQERAYVEVYFVHGPRRRRIHTFHANKIPVYDSRPQIVVSAHVRGDATVSLRIDGELIASETFPIPAEMRAARPWPWIAGIAALLLVAGLAIGVWWLSGSGWGTLARSDAPAGTEPLTDPEAVAERSSDLSKPRTTRSEPPTTRQQDTGPTAEGGPQLEPEETTPPGDTDSGMDEGDAPGEAPTERPAPGPGLLAEETTVYFEPESAQLSPQTRERLTVIADMIADWIASGGAPSDVAVAAEGHTALYDTEQSRLELSRERARAVAEYLTAALAVADVTGVRITTIGRGGKEPITRSEPRQWRNRRVEIVVTGEAE
jgi:outer membrane protein OmpA-like peptidoglycan-associated protein